MNNEMRMKAHEKRQTKSPNHHFFLKFMKIYKCKIKCKNAALNLDRKRKKIHNRKWHTNQMKHIPLNKYD